MSKLAEFRAQYPQYNDVGDYDLAASLHDRFYSDIPRDQFNRSLGLLSRQIDFAKPVEDVRSEIATLPEGERDTALRQWADDFVKRERKDGGTGQTVGDYVRQFSRGTPVGSWLDEANAATSSALHTVTGGAMGAPYDESVAYQRALDRKVDEDTGTAGTVAKVVGGLASAPVSPMLNVAKVGGAAGSAVNAGASGLLYGGAYGAGEGENLGERLDNAGQSALLGLGLGSVIGGAAHKGAELVGKRLSNAQTRTDDAARITEAGKDLGVNIPRAATSAPDEIGSLAKEVPPLPFMQNPVRREAANAVKGTREAFDRTAEGYKGGQSLEDWLAGRGAEVAASEATDAAPVGVSVTKAADTGPTRIITPDQSMEIGARPQLVELATLKTAAGKFQPRDRSRAEYVSEAQARAAKLDPEQLRPGRVSDSGAPIVLEDGTIISGNGRTMSIAEAYRNPALAERAQAYRASLGPEAANMREPVLVMRADPMAEDAAARFADLSNRGRIAQMSATERAARDAKALGGDGVSLYQGGDFEAPQNADFLRMFTGKAVTDGERAAFSKDGRLTQEGAARMRNAVLASAYDDSALLSRLVESSDDNVRNITGALADAAPGFSKLKADIASGVVPADMDSTKSITDAVKLIADLRNRGVSPATHFAQKDAFDAGDPLVEAWVRAFYNDDLSRPVSRQKMTAVLKAYTEEAGKKQAGGLFEDPTTSRDVLNVAKRAGAEVQSDTPAESLFGGAQGMGEGVRPGGGPAQRPEAAGSGGAVGPGGGLAAEPANVGQSLAATNRARLAESLGMASDAMSPGAVTDRVLALANSGKGADVTALLKARQTLGDDAWKGVVSDVIGRMGAGAKGRLDLEAFISAYGDMTENARNTLFGGAGAESLKRNFDNIATVAPKLDRLRELSNSKLDAIPIVGDILKSRTFNVSQVVWHPMLALKGLFLQIPAHVAASVLARPAVARDLSRWINAAVAASEKGNVAQLQPATRSLSNSISEATGRDRRDIEADLMGK